MRTLIYSASLALLLSIAAVPASTYAGGPVSDTQPVVIELNVQLQVGSRGELVKILQSLLATDPAIFSTTTVTGYYGPLTREAVKKFQKKHGIETAGRVGPKTLRKINDLFKSQPLAREEETQGKKDGCVKIPPGHLIAPGYIKKVGTQPVTSTCQILPPGILRKLTGTSTPRTPDTTAPVISSVTVQTLGTTAVTITWQTDELARGQISYGVTAAYGSETSLETEHPLSHTTTLTGLTASTTYHYQIRATDRAGNTATSSDYMVTTQGVVLDVTAPAISQVSAATTATTATITWQTNEVATTETAYGTSTAYSVVLADTALTTSHERVLTGLIASTTYHYQVRSQDAAGNRLVSDDFLFTTLPPLDVTAPVISQVSATATTTTATITWQTNETATSKVYYGTVSPLVLSTANTVNDTALVTSHSIMLSNLATSTTYYFVVESADARANTATSSEASFATSY